MTQGACQRHFGRVVKHVQLPINFYQNCTLPCKIFMWKMFCLPCNHQWQEHANGSKQIFLIHELLWNPMPTRFHTNEISFSSTAASRTILGDTTIYLPWLLILLQQTPLKFFFSLIWSGEHVIPVGCLSWFSPTCSWRCTYPCSVNTHCTLSSSPQCRPTWNFLTA